MKIRAAVVRKAGLPRPYKQSQPVTIEEVELAPPGPGEVLVKIRAAGVCHSDLSVVSGDVPLPLPIVLGHEAAGEVVELGAGVDDLALGDHVITLFAPACGKCVSCVEGRPTRCLPAGRANQRGTLLSGAKRLSKDGETLNHNLGASSFADHAVLARSALVKIDKSFAFEDAALFGCAVVTGAGAVVNTAEIKMGASVAVIGLGGVGLSALLAARAAGARRVIALDVRQDKLDFARTLGATDAFLATDADVGKKVAAATEGGADYAIETSGAVAGFDLAYRVIRRGGTVVTTSLPNAKATWALSPMHLVLMEATLKGSYMGTAVPSRDIPRFLDMFRQGRLPIDKLRSGTIRLDQINEAFDRLADGEVVRQVIVYS
ncbi:MAG TPA: zinc-dependent alcohol dehydrogenase family protein [Alphaproteobacteria bacterium]